MKNSWATWCPPCRKEMPDLSALCGQFDNQGLVILAIFLHRSKGSGRRLPLAPRVRYPKGSNSL
ncbi:MAG: TlpA disulfide reductase family protein [Bryobacteraceae bacterium]